MKNYILLLVGIFGVTLIACRNPKLMKYSDFSQLKELKLPKILKLDAENKSLLYIGTYHSNDKNDSIFNLIQNRLEEFQPDYVFHEGGSNWPIYADIDSTKVLSGEPGFLIQLCQNNKIEYASIEPQEKKEFEHLLSSYELKWVVLMFMCRQIDQQQRLAESYNTSDADFRNNMDYFFQTMLKNGMPLNNDQLKFDYWKAVYEELMDEKLRWRTFNPKLYYPNYYLTKLNMINRASDVFRNLHMVDAIMARLKTSNKVLVVLGGGHLVVQEKLLTHKFEKFYN